MSLPLDLAQLREHFVTNWDADAIQTVFANQDPAKLNKKEPFVRFAILPGDNARYLGGDNPLYSQLGRVTLQVFVPTGRGTAIGYEHAQAFTELFREWKSEDQCLRCSGHDLVSIPNGSEGLFQINVSVRWESLRRA